MAAVGEQRAIFHNRYVLRRHRLHAAGERNEYIAHARGFVHAHNLVSVHSGFQGAGVIDFGNDDVRAHAARAQRYAASAPAIARHHDFFARPKYVGGAGDAVQRALPGAVAVVEEVLGVGVVDRDDRIAQSAGVGEASQANDAGGGLFGAADDGLESVGALGVQRGDEVCAVVHRDVGTEVEGGVDVRVVGGVVFAFDGESGDAVFADQRRRHVVLRAEGIAGADGGLSAAVLQREQQVGGFGGNMQACGDAKAGERLVFGEALAYLAQHRHFALRPMYAADALGRQRCVSDMPAIRSCRQIVLLNRNATGCPIATCNVVVRICGYAAALVVSVNCAGHGDSKFST